MPASQVLNPKGTVKRTTTNDLPYSPIQPVLSKYTATSTANQNVINMTFSIDQSLTDQFLLYVDGKLLTLGSSNDYTFTSIASDNTSSQVTLNYNLPANLNILAYKLGLKKESEFLTDNRFTQLYAEMASGFQGFVSQTDSTITATTTTGTPAAGTFYSTITNRASMADLSQNLKARMGVERIPSQSIFQIQNEYGPNGETVSGLINDTFGQVRFVGNWTNSGATTSGLYILPSTSGSDYIEVTFYGTGLNCLFAIGSAAATITVATDGGAAGANIWSSSFSNVLSGRNYASDGIIKAVSGLTLGIHTVKINFTSAVQIGVQGFEFLNESSNITVSPGVGYVQGKKYTTSAQSTFAYNAIATGTRGGRVLVYQNGDGSIGSAWQAVNTSSALLTSADHTNEEVAKTYFPREFGAGRTDDFSRVSGSQVAAFTLDDGTTTLSSTGCNFSAINGYDALGHSASSQSHILTFVGTGLDIQYTASSLVGASFTYAIDGSTAAAITLPTSGTQIVKVVSGLPYGSHTFKLTLTAVTSGLGGIVKFMVYQPKKPSLPSGTVEIADYNVMANFSTSALTDNTANGALILAQGTLYKSIAREFVYTGANWTIQSSTTYPSGWDTSTSTNNSQPASYTFFGTGAVLTVENSVGGTFSVQVSVDGSLYATATALQNMSNGGGGTYTTTTATGLIPGRISISGLSLGIHTITIQRSAGTGSFFFPDIQLIVPIHSYKPNVYADLQNTLNIGSNSISDNRKSTPVKDALPAVKAWSQAVGVTATPTTTSTTAIPVPDLSCTIKTNGGPLDISYSAVVSNSGGAGDSVNLQVYVDGVAVGNSKASAVGTAGSTITDSFIVQVAPGYHKVDLYWFVNTSTGNIGARILTVRER